MPTTSRPYEPYLLCSSASLGSDCLQGTHVTDQKSSKSSLRSWLSWKFQVLPSVSCSTSAWSWSPTSIHVGTRNGTFRLASPVLGTGGAFGSLSCLSGV